MKRALVIAAVLGGCEAERPSLTDASGTFDTKCNGPQADLVVDVTPSTLDGKPALGAADSMSVTLMTNQVLTVGFIGLGGITDASGADIRVVGDIPSGASATAYVANSDMVFEHSGDISSGIPEIDLIAAMTLSTAVYLRLTGVSGTITIDAIEAVHDTCH